MFVALNVILIRTSIVLLLSGFLAIGQIPAWVHVACCHNHESTENPGQIDLSDGSGCSCAAHGELEIARDSSGLPKGNTPTAIDSGSPQQSHDSHNCVICRSLVSSASGVCYQDHVSSSDSLVERYFGCTDSCNISDHSLIFQPRGPPILA